MRLDQDNIVPVISPLKDQVWNLICEGLRICKLQALYIRTETPLIDYVEKIIEAPAVLIDWVSCDNRCSFRLEEVLDLIKNRDAKKKVIVIATNATFDNLCYIRDLGVSQIFSYQSDRELSKKELLQKLCKHFEASTHDRESVFTVQSQIDYLTRLIETYTPNQEGVDAEIESELASLAKHKQKKVTEEKEFILALWALARERPTEALTHIDRFLKHQPKSDKGLQVLGMCFVKSKEYSQAQDIFKTLIQRQPASLNRKALLADLYRKQGQLEKSEECYDEILKSSPAFTPALNGKAQLLFEQNRLDDAKEVLNQSAHAATVARALNLTGIQMVRNGCFDEALEHYKKAQFVLGNHEKGAVIFYNIALCYSKWGKLSNAVKFARLAIAKDPDYSKAKNLLLKLAAG